MENGRGWLSPWVCFFAPCLNEGGERCVRLDEVGRNDGETEPEKEETREEESETDHFASDRWRL